MIINLHIVEDVESHIKKIFEPQKQYLTNFDFDDISERYEKTTYSHAVTNHGIVLVNSEHDLLIGFTGSSNLYNLVWHVNESNAVGVSVALSGFKNKKGEFVQQRYPKVDLFIKSDDYDQIKHVIGKSEATPLKYNSIKFINEYNEIKVSISDNKISIDNFSINESFSPKKIVSQTPNVNNVVTEELIVKNEPPLLPLKFFWELDEFSEIEIPIVTKVDVAEPTEEELTAALNKVDTGKEEVELEKNKVDENVTDKNDDTNILVSEDIPPDIEENNELDELEELDDLDELDDEFDDNELMEIEEL